VPHIARKWSTHVNDQHPDDPTGAPEGSEPSIQVPDDASSITDAARPRPMR
jgi:hypothetical protein